MLSLCTEAFLRDVFDTSRNTALWFSFTDGILVCLSHSSDRLSTRDGTKLLLYPLPESLITVAEM